MWPNSAGHTLSESGLRLYRWIVTLGCVKQSTQYRLSAQERLVSLDRLIAEASVLAGGQHQCAVLGHMWITTGGRICPRGDEMGGGPCSQSVYECKSCGVEDYGEPGGPGYRDCYTLGPCDPGCLPETVNER